MTTDAPDEPTADETGEAPESSDRAETETEAEEPVSYGSRRADTRAKSKKHLPVWQESILLLVIALGLAIVIKAFFVQAFYIPSASMEPGLQGGKGIPVSDRILVEKPSYWFGGSPQRGDVIVFADPGGWLSAEEDKAPTGFASLLAKVGLYPTGGHLVKRVIGTSGDTIHCCTTKGRIKINGHAVDEDGFLSDAAKNAPCDAPVAVRFDLADSKYVRACNWTIGPVPAGKLFVMGDNRTNSSDSRAHLCGPGPADCTKSPWVDEDLVVGKVFALVWPHSRWTWIGTPDVFKDVPDAS